MYHCSIAGRQYLIKDDEEGYLKFIGNPYMRVLGYNKGIKVALHTNEVEIDVTSEFGNDEQSNVRFKSIFIESLIARDDYLGISFEIERIKYYNNLFDKMLLKEELKKIKTIKMKKNKKIEKIQSLIKDIDDKDFYIRLFEDKDLKEAWEEVNLLA